MEVCIESIDAYFVACEMVHTALVLGMHIESIRVNETMQFTRGASLEV